jgi:hypothetical protein
MWKGKEARIGETPDHKIKDERKMGKGKEARIHATPNQIKEN